MSWCPLNDSEFIAVCPGAIASKARADDWTASQLLYERENDERERIYLAAFDGIFFFSRANT
jgi:hypothetical protein